MDLIDLDALLKDMGLTDAVKYGNKDAEQQYHSYSTLMLYEIADAILDAPTVNLWIPCSERLPEKDTDVIVCCYGSDLILTHDGETMLDAVSALAESVSASLLELSAAMADTEQTGFR